MKAPEYTRDVGTLKIPNCPWALDGALRFRPGVRGPQVFGRKLHSLKSNKGLGSEVEMICGVAL